MYNFSNASTFYVSQAAGNSRYSGLTPQPDQNGNGPLPSLEQALRKIRELRRGGMKQPVSIKIMDSVYTLKQTLVIDETTDAVTIESFGASPATISGGRRITGFTRSVFRGTDCFAAFIPEVKSGEWAFTDLYVDGIRADLTRYPETGFMVPEGVENPHGDLWDGSKWFIAREGDFPADIYRPEDMLVSFTHYWIDEHTPVESYDPETRKVTCRYRSRFEVNAVAGTKSCMEYYLENLAEAFKRPNQWYLDRPNGMLYYIPRDEAQTPESIEVWAPVLTTLISVQGDPEKGKAQRIRLKNLHFICSRGDYCSPAQLDAGESTDPNSEDMRASDPQSVCAAPGMLEFCEAHGCTVEDCTLSCFGLTGIVLRRGCQSCRMTGNQLLQGGACGIRMTGGKDPGQPQRHTWGNLISDNTILHMGRRYLAGCGILLMDTYENEVSHNEIADLYYTGISVGWIWGYADSITRDNRIEKNHIHHLGQGVLSDMGGIYLLGLQPGTIVSGNVIHDIKARFYGGWALYTDEGSSYITLENNICYRTSETGYHQHYGCMNTVRNNIFAFSDEYMLRLSKPELHLGLIFDRNIILADNVPIYGPDFDGYPTRCCAAHNNLIFDRSHAEPVLFRHRDSGRTLSLEDMRSLYGMEDGSVIADTCFADADHDDFTLLSESPALKLGFCPIDTRDVGPRR
ncbi:MAG: right-handed parallel beta-helix repeat-containing protein [Oscillospiraceae bacterium]|nr:right-handed parallel beta-helix repeat-containing protein [Oscillospiraceae bacterium]